jgi:hypothetical protein
LRGGPPWGFTEDGGFGADGQVIVEGLQGAGDFGGVSQGDSALGQCCARRGQWPGQSSGQVDTVGGGAGGEA